MIRFITKTGKDVVCDRSQVYFVKSLPYGIEAIIGANEYQIDTKYSYEHVIRMLSESGDNDIDLRSPNIANEYIQDTIDSIIDDSFCINMKFPKNHKSPPIYGMWLVEAKGINGIYLIQIPYTQEFLGCVSIDEWAKVDITELNHRDTSVIDISAWR